ncbi:MAG: FAD:protein FMN transferase [Ruminococcaceae bacterium]|nr:FAD:protein FMN transferase [Oscillospiraceae bacterium]
MKLGLRTVSLCLCALLCVSALSGCSQRQEKMTDVGFDLFDSFYELILYSDSREEFEGYAALCRSELEKYHRLLDIYHDYDGLCNLKTVNDHAGEAVAVSSELFAFLQYAKKLHTLTNGYTNIAMGSVLTLWHEARTLAADHPSREGTPPDADAIAQALTHTDIHDLLLSEDGATVTLSDPLMSLDAGAVGKGYAAKQVASALREAGCDAFLLNVGGNTVAYGEKPDGELWSAEIYTPEGHAGYGHALTLSDQALVTSGSYERYFVCDGVRYHHILHPQTGYPSSAYVSVSVRCADSGMADALSTALFSMTEEEGMALIASLPDTEAVWMTSDGRTLVSDGLAVSQSGGDA